MSDTPRTLSESVHVDASPEAVYDLVSDQTRVGEWSPVCKAVAWDDPARAGEVGATFTGHNETADRSWSTTSTVIAADRPHRFAWTVGDGLVHWSFDLAPDDGGTLLTESWELAEAGERVFRERYGDRADAEIDDRARAAVSGVPASLQAIKQIVEAG